MKDGESGKVLWQQNSDFSKVNIEHEARIPKKILKVKVEVNNVKPNLIQVQKHLPRTQLQLDRGDYIFQPDPTNFLQVSKIFLNLLLATHRLKTR